MSDELGSTLLREALKGMLHAIEILAARVEALERKVYELPPNVAFGEKKGGDE